MLIMRSTKGVPITIIRDGRMNAINGRVRSTGRRAARSSKRASRSARISAARSRKDPASGGAKLIDWLSVATMLRRLARPVPLRQVFKGFAADRRHTHFGCRRGEFFGDLRARRTENAADLLDRVIEAEPRFGADDEKIERVGHAGFKACAAPLRRDGKGRPQESASPGDRRRPEAGSLKVGRSDKEFDAIEKQPTERDEMPRRCKP